MFYVAVCRQCNHLMFSGDIRAFKRKVMDHFKDSHNYTVFTRPRPPLEEIAKKCTFIKVSDEVGVMLGRSKRFWHTYRNSDKLARQLVG